jgi:hypothetical protein
MAAGALNIFALQQTPCAGSDTNPHAHVDTPHYRAAQCRCCRCCLPDDVGVRPEISHARSHGRPSSCQMRLDAHGPHKVPGTHRCTTTLCNYGPMLRQALPRWTMGMTGNMVPSMIESQSRPPSPGPRAGPQHPAPGHLCSCTSVPHSCWVDMGARMQAVCPSRSMDGARGPPAAMPPTTERP